MTLRIACLFDPRGLADFERGIAPGDIDMVILPELCDGARGSCGFSIISKKISNFHNSLKKRLYIEPFWNTVTQS
jgi:hypothetical protein